jgi:predicted phage terminase large subunit-like protein
MEQNNILSNSIIETMIKDRKVRAAVTRESHLTFFHFYFAHYVKYPTAEFQREIFRLTERDEIKNLFIVSFRGSSKSTIITTSYPIWAILGKQQKKFVLILCQTKSQAKQHMMNLRRELENNQLLKNDLGPFQEEDEWGSTSLVFSKMNARITIASTEQSIRGLRHNQYRPDLIIGDDLEDIASTKTREGRQKTYQWLTSEVIPCGDKDTRLVIVGNLLHEDSLIMHLKRDIEEGKLDGVYKEYPLIDDKKEIQWPGKYPTMDDIQVEKKKIGNEISWHREYLLHIVPDEDQLIHTGMLNYYNELPKSKDSYRMIMMGVDLAISQKTAADDTAIVSALICGHEDQFKIYILPNVINRKMDFTQIIEQITAVHDANAKIYSYSKIYIEDVGFQQSTVQVIDKLGYNVEGVRPDSDKRSRLVTISHLIQNGTILFPKQGAEYLIQQLIGFGVERHDDLVDAFTIVAHKALAEDKAVPKIILIDNPFLRRY